MKLTVLALFALVVACAAGVENLRGNDHPEYAVAEKFYSLQSSGKCEDWVALFSDDFSVEDPQGSDPITDKKTLLTNCQGASSVFSTVDMKATETYPSSGKGVSAKFHVASVAKNGCKLNFDGVDTFILDENTKIVKMFGFFDTSIPEKQMNCK